MRSRLGRIGATMITAAKRLLRVPPETAFYALALLIASNVAFAAQQSASARSSKALATQFIDAYCQHVQLQEELGWKKKAPERLSDDVLKHGDADAVGPDSAVLNELNSFFLSYAERVGADVEQFDKDCLQDKLKKLKESWLDVRTERNMADALKAEWKTTGVTSRWVALVGKDLRWFWAATAFAIAGLVCVSVHDRRHEIRRRKNDAKARGMKLDRLLKGLFVFLVIVTIAAFVGIEPLVRHLTSSSHDDDLRDRKVLAAEVAELEADCGRIQEGLADVGPAYEAKRDAWASAETDESLRELWKQMEKKTLECRVHVAQIEAVADQLDTDAKELRKLQSEQQENQEAVVQLQTFKWAVSGGVGASLLGLTVLLAVGLIVKIQQRERNTKKTCPVCLDKKLQVITYGTGVGLDDNRVEVHCPNDLPTNPPEPCDFRVGMPYQKMPKAYFPTFGIRGAGKTHWLTMVYHDLSKGSFRRNAQFMSVKSSATDKFDRLVDEIIKGRMTPGATRAAEGLPRPLLFHFKDKDPWGTTDLLVNVFDYSGEIADADTSGQDIRAVQRRRALRADGFLYFLDPTQESGKQIEALNAIRQDLFAMGQFRPPVALCVTKIDCLEVHSDDLGRPPIRREEDKDGKSYVDKWFEKLRDIAPTDDKITEDILDARSDLGRKLCEKVWPGLGLETLVHNFSRGRCKYFPLTPVALDNPENHVPGQPLDERDIDPFGIVEPLVWLLHMNGYPILDENDKQAVESSPKQPSDAFDDY